MLRNRRVRDNCTARAPPAAVVRSVYSRFASTPPSASSAYVDRLRLAADLFDQVEIVHPHIRQHAAVFRLKRRARVRAPGVRLAILNVDVGQLADQSLPQRLAEISKLGSSRRTMPAASTRRTAPRPVLSSSHAARVNASGFSHSTCSPCSSARCAGLSVQSVWQCNDARVEPAAVRNFADSVQKV